MARYNISPRKHAKRFQKGRKQMRKVNAPSHIMRGGFRL